MNEPAQIDIAKSFLDDERAEVRDMASRILCDIDDPRVEYLLAILVHDPDPSVAERGVQTIVQRNPWLLLAPFFVRNMPDAAQDSWQGKRWTALCAGLQEVLQKRRSDIDVRLMSRWLKVPGFLPELVATLKQMGWSALGSELADAGDLYGCSFALQRQVLFAPTYRCNIQCSYCYAKEWMRDSPADFPLEKFDTLFQWLKRTESNHLNICGGEPTVYRYLAQLLERAEGEEVSVSITTNAIYGRRIRDLLRRFPVARIVGHYDQEVMRSRPRTADDFVNNLVNAQQAGSEVFLRYTLTVASDADEWYPILEIAERLDIPSINYGVAFGNMEGTNTHYDFRFGEVNPAFEEQFIRFEQDCAARGLRLHQCKPIPLCAFSLPTLTRFLLDGTLRAACAAYLGDCTRNLTINPDLTTFPCNAIGVRGPKIDELTDLTEASAHFQPLIQNLLQRPFASSCEDCFHFYRGFCQGVCMAQHFSSGKGVLS